MFTNIELTFCPADSPNIIKNNSKIVLSSNGGQGVLVELYDYFISNKLLKEPSLESVLALDAKELTSSEMK
jgi:3-deoxy-D-manno-octulosonate 8-phosphate phosphatase KdsC-like HAD superfamily phosphatase